MKHASVPVFVPHAACPNICVFCNQKKIAGTEQPIKDPYAFLKKATDEVPSSFTEMDIAFFGGSFTALPFSEMERYLEAARRVREQNPRVTGIRLSTRPDAIREDILSFLCAYGVTAVELGVQSMVDSVLEASRRGHTAEDTRKAVACLKKYPVEIGLQLMPGLPTDTEATIRYTIDEALRLCPHSVRLYPCIVVKDTVLETMYQQKEFTPLTLENAVRLCAEAVSKCRERGIRVLRTGLHSSDLVRNDSVVAGPFHPAFGEMVLNEIYLQKILARLPEQAGPVRIAVSPGALSKAIGQQGRNKKFLEKKTGQAVVFFEDAQLSEEEVKVICL